MLTQGDDELLRLVVVDEPEIVVAGLRSTLEIAGVQSALIPVDELAVADLVLVDPISSDDGCDRLGRMLDAGGKVAGFSWAAPTRRYLEFVDRGIRGWISKSSTAPDLVRALRTTAAGEASSPAELVDEDRTARTALAEQYELSPRELEILALIAQGLSNKDITSTLFLSINTVKTYVRTGYRKINATSRTQAVLWCIDNGLAHRPPGTDTRLAPAVASWGRG